MRSRLLQSIDKYEEDMLAQEFIEEFSLYKNMFDRKKERSVLPAATDCALEVVATRQKEILTVSHLGGLNRRYKSLNCNPEDNNVRETILKLKGLNSAEFCPKSPFKGYIYRSGCKSKAELENNSIIEIGDFLYADINGYQYVVSFIPREEIPACEQKGFELDTEELKPFYYSIALHALIALMFIVGSFFTAQDKRMTKKNLDRFVSVNIKQLKEKKIVKPEPKKKEILVKADEKKVEKVVEVVKKVEKKIAKQVTPKKKVEKASKMPPVNKVQMVSKTEPKGQIRTSRNPGYTNNKAQANVKKPTPSIATSALFQGLGGIGSSKKEGGGATRALASVTNIKGVKSSTPGAYNISGAIGKVGGDDIQIVRGGSVQTNGYGGGVGPGAAGRSVATGYIANLGKEASGGVVGGAVVNFPEEEGQILEGQGSLSRAEIFKVIERHARAFRYCYEKQLLKDPSIHGKVVLNWTISKSGAVEAAKWKSSQIQSSEVNTCLISRLRDLHFPKPKGNAVTVDFPFVFTSASF